LLGLLFAVGGVVLLGVVYLEESWLFIFVAHIRLFTFWRFLRLFTFWRFLLIPDSRCVPWRPLR
jgi:hypothetical protein